MKLQVLVGDKLWDGSGFKVQPLSKENQARIDSAVGRAKKLDVIFDETDVEKIMDSRREIKGLLKQIDADRESVKGPFLNAGRAIDAEAKKYTANLEAQERRLKKLTDDHALEKAQARERELREKEEAAKALYYAEQKKLEALKEKEGSSKEAIIKQELVTELAANTTVSEDYTPLVAGGTTRQEPRFRLVNAAELFATNPKLAAKLLDCSLRINACKEIVRDMLNSGLSKQQVFIAGIEITFAPSVGVTGTSQIVQA